MSSTEDQANNTRVIAVPVTEDRLCVHFGHCEKFALLDVDVPGKAILNSRRVTPPPHQPGVLPRWLRDQGVHLVIAGGMGGRAQGIFGEEGIEVIAGATPDTPESLAMSYLNGSLKTGENICDH